MFIKFPPFLMFAEGEGGDSGTGSESVSTQEPAGTQETSQQETSQQETQSESSSGHNPNWDGLLNELPDEYLRGKARPFLEEYDRNNNKRFEQVQQRYEPYKALADNQIPFEDIQLAFRLQNEIQQNPQDVFNRLAGFLGYDISGLNRGPEQQGNQQRQGNQPQNQSQGQTQTGLPEGVDLEDLDPRIRQLFEAQQAQQLRIQQTNDAILQSLMLDKQREAQIQQHQQEERWYSDTVSSLDRLNVPKEQRNFFVQFAVADAQMNGGNVDFDRAYKTYQSQIGTAVQSRANSSAPDVSSGIGNLARDAVDWGKMTDDDVEKMALARLKQANGGK